MRTAAPLTLALCVALGLGACRGVDPLLAQPPAATRPDVVLATPPALRQALAGAEQDTRQVRSLLAQPLWSDALAQSPDAFRATLARQRPELAAAAPVLQEQIGALFTQAATVSQTASQIQLRLRALDGVRERTGFARYVASRAELYNRRAQAQREQARYGGAADRYATEASGYRTTAGSGRVERIDYVDSAGRVVASRYTPAHDEKQRARLLLPFADSASRDLAERAAAEQERAQQLGIEIAATRSGDMEQVERQLYEESDLITQQLWPRLEAAREQLRQTQQRLLGLSAPGKSGTPGTPAASVAPGALPSALSSPPSTTITKDTP